MTDKKMKVQTYEEYEPKRGRIKLGLNMNFYLSDIGGLIEVEGKNDCCINLAGQLFIVNYPYEKLLAEWEAYRSA